MPSGGSACIALSLLVCLGCKGNGHEVARSDPATKSSASTSATASASTSGAASNDASVVATNVCGSGPLAVDETSVFWLETSSECAGRLMRAPKSGGAATEMAKLVADPADTDVRANHSLVVAGDRVFYDDVTIEFDGSPHADSDVCSVPRGGGPVTKHAHHGDVWLAAARNGDVFVAARLTAPEEALTLERIPSGDVVPVALAKLSSKMTLDVGGMWVDDKDVWMLWHEGVTPHVSVVARAGGPVVPLPSPCNAASDARCDLGNSRLFCSCLSPIEAIPRHGPKSVFVTEKELGTDAAFVVRVDGDDVWWSAGEDAKVAHHRPQRGGPIADGARPLLPDVAFDAAFVYVRGDDRTIRRLPK